MIPNVPIDIANQYTPQGGMPVFPNGQPADPRLQLIQKLMMQGRYPSTPQDVSAMRGQGGQVSGFGALPQQLKQLLNPLHPSIYQAIYKLMTGGAQGAGAKAIGGMR